jgi:hypothetical protein
MKAIPRCARHGTKNNGLGRDVKGANELSAPHTEIYLLAFGFEELFYF